VIPTGSSGKSSSIDASNGRAVVLGPGGKSRPVRLRFRWDGLFKLGTLLCGLTASILILWIGYQLYSVSALSREKFGWHLLTNSKWDETREIYGALPYIYGSVLTAILALIIAVPLAVGCAVFLTQYAPRWLAVPVAFFLDLLAAVPSIIFGLWGILVVCPWMQAHINHWLVDHFGSVPFFAGPALSFTNVLAAGVILALMILPFITAVSREVLLAIPPGFREASMGLGATRWETIKLAVLPASASGIIGAAMLGLGRAVGETMAVVMVIGNTPQIKLSLLQPGESMTALLANKFNEAFSDPMQLSALLEIALILFVFTFILNAIARLLIRLTSKVGTKGEPAVWIQTSKASLGFAFRYGVTAALILLVLVQAVSDVKRSGPVGLFGPFEVLAVAYVGIRFAEVRLCGTKNWDRFRKANDFTMRALCALTSVMACTGLFLLLAYVTKNGVHGVNVALFTQDPRPADMAGGGLRPAILGTMTVVALACLIGIPVGVMGGIYLSEYPESRLGSPMRFAADVLNGIPSVVIGMFAYAAFVLPVKHFSAIAGGAALGIMMIPTVIRVTDEMMRLVPSGIREASLGLGASRMQTTLKVILPAARKGVVIGILLAIARVSGETAPLLFTAFGSDHVTTNLREPISTLTLKIFQYAQSAQDNWISQAWAGAFVLLLMIFVISLAARLATRNKFV
jgi:phosphate transport system permease protein